ncbi:unnamed protein product, partial [Protopolystoma xenopodis]
VRPELNRPGNPTCGNSACLGFRELVITGFLFSLLNLICGLFMILLSQYRRSSRLRTACPNEILTKMATHSPFTISPRDWHTAKPCCQGNGHNHFSPAKTVQSLGPISTPTSLSDLRLPLASIITTDAVGNNHTLNPAMTTISSLPIRLRESAQLSSSPVGSVNLVRLPRLELDSASCETDHGLLADTAYGRLVTSPFPFSLPLSTQQGHKRSSCTVFSPVDLARPASSERQEVYLFCEDESPFATMPYRPKQPSVSQRDQRNIQSLSPKIALVPEATQSVPFMWPSREVANSTGHGMDPRGSVDLSNTISRTPANSVFRLDRLGNLTKQQSSLLSEAKYVEAMNCGIYSTNAPIHPSIDTEPDGLDN